MPHVLGLPIIKGNSQVITTGSKAATGGDNVTEGVAVSLVSGTIEPVVGDLVTGKFHGFAVDIYTKSSKLSIVRQAEMLPVRTDGTTPAVGEPVLLVPATGLVSSTGTTQISGRVESGLISCINGKTGETVADCVLINLGLGQSEAVGVPAAAAAAKAAKANK